VGNDILVTTIRVVTHRNANLPGAIIREDVRREHASREHASREHVSREHSFERDVIG